MKKESQSVSRKFLKGSIFMKLNYKRTLFVGFAFFLISAFWQAYDNIIPKILTDKFGLSQVISGMVMALDNVLAVILLPVFGALSDKTKTKVGRRTPFILIGTLLAVILFVSLSVADNMQLDGISEIAAVTRSDDEDYRDAMTALYNSGVEIEKSGLQTTKTQSGMSGSFLSLSPLPSATAVPQMVQKGTSLPTRLPSSARAPMDNGSP